MRLFLVVCLFLLAIPTTAQDDIPAPQFLYRDENRLVLVNGYTGETTELPLEVSDQDRFEWSPDGKYLLAQLDDGENYGNCLNLYDVDEQKWVYNEPISCGVWETIFSSDSNRLVYTSSDSANAVLWLYNLADETQQELYRTVDGHEISSMGVSDFEWSPTEHYLTFVSYLRISGGTLNSFIIMDMESLDYVEVSAPNPYYASYYPMWSPDEQWFLIRLQEEYVTTSTIPYTNHAGDIYLFNSKTGDSHRLTYTPAIRENNFRWLKDGTIAYTGTVEVTLTLEEAMGITPPDTIVMPEMYDEDFYSSLDNVMASPDTAIGALILTHWAETEGYSYELYIGRQPDVTYEPHFYKQLSDNSVIGWRPSDYDYSEE